MVFSVNRLIKPTNSSATSWALPGTFLSFRVHKIERSTKNAMMPQVTTTDSGTGIPPKTGMVNAILLLSLLSSSSRKASNSSTFFLKRTARRTGAVLP